MLRRLVESKGVEGDYEMMLRVAAGITGLNLCALGDSIEPFLKSVLLRFPDQFKARLMKSDVVAHASQPRMSASQDVDV